MNKNLNVDIINDCRKIIKKNMDRCYRLFDKDNTFTINQIWLNLSAINSLIKSYRSIEYLDLNKILIMLNESIKLLDRKLEINKKSINNIKKDLNLVYNSLS